MGIVGFAGLERKKNTIKKGKKRVVVRRKVLITYLGNL